MEPSYDETRLPVIRLQAKPPLRRDLLATITFWLALAGVSTILCGWTQLPSTTHGPDSLLARYLTNVGALFAIAALLLTVLLVVRNDRSTRVSRLATWLSVVGIIVVLLSPAF